MAVDRCAVTGVEHRRGRRSRGQRMPPAARVSRRPVVSLLGSHLERPQGEGRERPQTPGDAQAERLRASRDAVCIGPTSERHACTFRHVQALLDRPAGQSPSRDARRSSFCGSQVMTGRLHGQRHILRAGVAGCTDAGPERRGVDHRLERAPRLASGLRGAIELTLTVIAPAYPGEDLAQSSGSTDTIAACNGSSPRCRLLPSRLSSASRPQSR